MILDTVNNLKQYVSLNPLFQDVLDFLKNNDLKALAPGKHVIKGDDLFVNVQEAAPKTRTEARLESHRVMIDIQIPITAGEEMGFTPLCDLPDAPYDEAKDMIFYPGLAESYFNVKLGEMAIFFPEDGHAPAISSQSFRKAIFKVKA